MTGDRKDDYAGMLDRLAAQREAALGMGGAARLQRRREAGVLNARERLDRLLDPGSFRELGLFATSERSETWERTPADGKIAGFGHIDGRPVFVAANDFTVMGASSSPTNMRKLAHMKRLAAERGQPVIWLGESSGARIPDMMGAKGMASSGQDPQQYTRYRESPWVSGVLGNCFGSSTWYACLSDFVVMRKGAVLAVAGPRVTGGAIAETVDPEDLGGWRLHAEETGLADQIVDTDEEAMAAIRRFLSYLPGNAEAAPPRGDPDAEAGQPGEALLDIVPVNRGRVYDMRKLVAAVVDRDSFFPLKPRYGKAVVTGLARLAGRSVGIVASNPMVKGGALDPDACSKVTSFLVLCDSFNIPLVFLVDTPGFLVGREGERKRAPGRIMNYMQALQMCSVPKIALVIRKLYGQAYLNFGGGRNSDVIGAWPGAEISFMDPELAVRVVHGDGLQVDDPQRYRAELAAFHADASAEAMARLYAVQEIVDPRQTRSWLAGALDGLMGGADGIVSRHRLGGWPTTL